ncbi:Telomerase reverse transcriptase protein [Dioscorea alata]|uniref:Telomerase reverse transcriptase protein n=2 Tax=Dioscorea alata TaxID=55571 RepID=A0ACB7U8W7_DIOAL|nr:Telomerase reverse transcriptase protein [Dioscorea alata]KAH7656721.1 Telomerase reverse transcriptase protein [Dioscorea alata]
MAGCGRRRRPRRIPVALLKIYGDRALTLRHAILSLLPPPPPSPSHCTCLGFRCLACVRGPYLLRDGDSSDYRRFLSCSFCVLSSDAPPPPKDFVPCGFAQRLIVENTLELIVGMRKSHENVLCNGYDNVARRSPNVELLSTSTWALLLSRIGDPLMVFLLQFSSIFVPLMNKSYHQVTGFPIYTILSVQNYSFNSSKFTKKRVSGVGKSTCYGHISKRRRIDFEERDKDTYFRVHQPGGLLGFNDSTKSIGVGRMIRMHAKDCQTYDGQKNMVDCSIPVGCLESSSSLELVDRKNMRTSLCHHSADSFRLQSCGTVNVESGSESKNVDKTFCVHNNSCYSKSAGSVFPLQPVIIHSVETVFPCHQRNDGACASVDTTNFRKSTNFRKRGRQFSWHRRRKNKKASYSREYVSNNPTSGKDDVSSKMAQQQNFSTVCQQPAEPARTISCGVFTDKGQISVSPLDCNLSEDLEATIKEHDFISRDSPINERVATSPNVLPSYEVSFQDSGSFTCLKVHLTLAILVHLFFDSRPSNSFHCSMQQAAKKVTMRTCIERRHIFYSKSSSYLLFPRHHILNKLKPNNEGATYLMEIIFGFPHGGSNSSISCNLLTESCPIRSKCLYHSLLHMLKSLIRNSQRCQYRKLLNKHCKSPTIKKSDQLHEKTQEDSTMQFDLVGSYCRHDQVVSFIWAVTRNIIPTDMLGGFSTWRALRKNIAKFVRLRRFEKFCVEDCIHGLKTSSFSFLHNIRISSCYCNSENKYEDEGMKINPLKITGAKLSLHNKLIQSWIFWLFSYILTPIISSNFYVTEKESGKQDVFYYLKPVWRHLVGRAIVCLRKCNYKLVESGYVGRVLSKRQFGFSKVRFLPKGKSLRPLANLKAPSKLRCSNQEFTSRSSSSVAGKCVGEDFKSMKTHGRGLVTCLKSVNSALHELHAILRSIVVEDPDKLGSSVFDYNDIYQKLCHFLSKIKKECSIMPKIYIVIADVTKAFDSIDQDILIKIMKEVIKNEEYAVRKYAQIICNKSPITLYKQATFDESERGFDVKSFQASTRLCSSRGILADKGIIKKIKQQKLLCLLHEHVKCNILRVDHSFYIQKLGISQGSLVSALLCSFYYGNLEKNMIYPYLEKTQQESDVKAKGDEELVIDRCTGGQPKKHEFDEGILLSDGRHDCLNYGTNTSAEMQAASFLSRMRRGFREYNCYMNAEKFGLNFEISESKHMVNRIYIGADGIKFLPWSGLFINCQTLEIQADYMRYLGAHLRSTITMHMHPRPFYHLRAKLCAYMRPKCHPIFYDSKINSLATVGLNAYQAFLLCAMKFHCYVCGMPAISHLDPNYSLDMIQNSFSYFYELIKKQMRDMELRFNIHPGLQLKKAEFIWLGLSAYIRVLKKKQSRYKDLLLLLRFKLARHGRIVDPLPHLKYAIDDFHSSIFWKIKY